MTTAARQATRPDPVPVEVVALKTQILVPPVPWRKRNDLGKLIVEVYSDAVQGLRDANELKTTSVFFDATIDYEKILSVALPDVNIDDLVWTELMEVCHAICDVNGLDSLKSMLDPNYQDPRLQDLLREISDGQKTTSTEDSSELVLALVT